MSYLGWRWIFWVLLIFAGSCFLLAVFLLPEARFLPSTLRSKCMTGANAHCLVPFASLHQTLASAILTKKAKKLRKEGHSEAFASAEKADRSIKAMAHATLLRPFDMLVRRISLAPSPYAAR
jgi:DHA1 family multidrug resistance protein-like MFS transporter